MNLPDRQIIGCHVGKHKTAEFDNWLLEDCFKVFNITHSLSKKIIRGSSFSGGAN
jgi:hypothetical protein